MWFAAWHSSLLKGLLYFQCSTKFWLDYPITSLPPRSPSPPILHASPPPPMSIPECKQMWKVKYHPQGYRLLFNSHYTIMDTHLTFFPLSCLFVIRELSGGRAFSNPHTSSALVTWPALVVVLPPFFSLLFLAFLPSCSSHSSLLLFSAFLRA